MVEEVRESVGGGKGKGLGVHPPEELQFLS